MIKLANLLISDSALKRMHIEVDAGVRRPHILDKDNCSASSEHLSEQMSERLATDYNKEIGLQDWLLERILTTIWQLQ